MPTDELGLRAPAKNFTHFRHKKKALLRAAATLFKRGPGSSDLRDLHKNIFLFKEFLEVWVPERTDTVSFVVPTYNRRHLVERAITSILESSYVHVEVVVVDDGSADGTAQFLDEIVDPRVVSLRQNNRGLQAARNAGLEAATGSVVAYLDDDNVCHRDWAKTVAWAFERYPQYNVVYGARLIEDDSRRGVGWAGTDAIALDWAPFDAERLRKNNYIDANVVAHRRGILGSVFPEGVGLQAGDYGQLLQLLELHAPFLALPAIACTYFTRHPNRMSASDERYREFLLFANQARTARDDRR